MDSTQEKSKSRVRPQLILHGLKKKKRHFLLSQLTTCCCSNTLPQAMQLQLHHLPWKDSREERAAESATSWGSSITMTVLCYEFTWNLTSPVPVSCSQTPTLFNCYFWCVLLYPDVLITFFSLSAGFICLSPVCNLLSEFTRHRILVKCHLQWRH